MRFIVLGVGAIGGVVGGRLAASGHEVLGVARGAQLDAIRSNGLLVESWLGEERIPLQVVASPADIDFRPDDVILLCVKSQHAEGALQQLRAAGVHDQPIVCAQNGVANEPLALRYFPNIYGATIWLPSNYLEPGHVVAFPGPKLGAIDLGRYPRGADDVGAAIAAALNSAEFTSELSADIMPLKYGKLLSNLVNSPQAVLGLQARNSPIGRAVRKEGLRVFDAAGIAYVDIDPSSPRLASVVSGGLKGKSSPGGSSWQSLARGADSIEADYLNGEVVWLGRMNGVPTPVNAYFVDLAHRMVRERQPAGSFPIETALRDLAPFLSD